MQLSRLMLIAGAVLLGANEVRPDDADNSPAPPVTSAPEQLRVMTYNVKGLPWPIATGRPAQLEQIGLQLRAMRQRGTQPHIVLLQEAFTGEAKAIGRLAGYRHIAFGPGAGSAIVPAAEALAPGHAAAASALKGEGLGQWLDGGLVIFSDFPIEDSAATVFPAEACAGFDCLAAKGVQVVRIRPPGAAETIAVINTHLNSDASSTGVGAARSDAGFAWQYAALRRLVDRLPQGTPAIFGGDVNIGSSPQRRRDVARIGAPLAASEEALPQALNRSQVPARDLAAVHRIRDKNIDQVFHRSSRATTLALTALSVPFGTGEPASLSDHAAVMTTYRLSFARPAAAAARREGA